MQRQYSVNPYGFTSMRPIEGHASKRIGWKDGRLAVIESHECGVWFKAYERTFTDITDLYNRLLLCTISGRLIVRGALLETARADRCRPAVNPATWGAPADMCRVPRAWTCIDIDEQPYPATIDAEDGAALGEYFRGRLPEEFHRAGFVWHLSNSHTVKTGACMHLFFLLDRPWSSAALGETFHYHNETGRTLDVDPCTQRDVQKIYMANPRLDGCPDPLPKRLGYVLDEDDVVQLVKRKPAGPVPMGGGRAGGMSWRQWADKVGTDGHYRDWILRACNALVGSSGGNPRAEDVAALKSALRAAVLGVEHAQRYVSDESIDDMIRSARARGYGQKVRSIQPLPLESYMDGSVRL